MKTVLMLDGRQVALDPQPTFATAEVPCPHCAVQPLRVQGSGRSIGGHDYYRADGFCADCGAGVGEIRAYVSTIFGLEEDEAVLYGRPRVY